MPEMIPDTIIDAHCHLDFECFDHDRKQVIERAQRNKVSDIIIPGTQQEYWQRIGKLCQHPALHACYGLHPYWVSTHQPEHLDALEHIIVQQPCLAVGECGLDYRPQQADKKSQQYFFEAQLDIAENAGLPVVIHAVRATEDVILLLKKHPELKGMIHSYSGSTEQAQQLVDMGFYISLGGAITYENAKKARNTVKSIPLTSLLIETDAPDQTDQSHQGRRNEPAYLLTVLQAVAQLRQEDEQRIAQQTRANTQDLFKL